MTAETVQANAPTGPGSLQEVPTFPVVISEETRLRGSLYEAERRRRAWLSRWLPIAVIVLAVEAILSEIITYLYTNGILHAAEYPTPLMDIFIGNAISRSMDYPWSLLVAIPLHVVPIWVLTLGIIWPLYYYGVRAPLRQAQQAFGDYQQQAQRERLSTFEGRLSYLQEEVRRLSHVTARVFMDNHLRYEQAKEWREKAEEILDQEGANLGEAQSLVSSIDELIVREEGELRAQRNWRYIAIGIIVFYLAMLVGIVLANAGNADALVPVFGVPLSVVMWSAAGSLAAILYRFYTEKKRVRLDLEVRWLIARPVIGIIMGAVVYLALKAGLFLLNPVSQDGTATPASSMGVYWVVAFIAGFSDKFYIKIIDLLVERAIGGEEEKTDEDDKDSGTEDKPVPKDGVAAASEPAGAS